MKGDGGGYGQGGEEERVGEGKGEGRIVEGQ